MSDEPQFPPIPSIGEILDRKKQMVEAKFSVVKCKSCGAKKERPFQEGDYVFKKLSEENCDSCKTENVFIAEIFSEWKMPEKK